MIEEIESMSVAEIKGDIESIIKKNMGGIIETMVILEKEIQIIKITEIQVIIGVIEKKILTINEEGDTIIKEDLEINLVKKKTNLIITTLERKEGNQVIIFLNIQVLYRGRSLSLFLDLDLDLYLE